MLPAFRLLVILAIASPACAWAKSPVWNVVADRSSLTFSATQVGQTITGEFKSFAADIRFDPADLASAHVVATIDMGSVDTGDGQRNAALPTADWFNSETFPRATFEAKDFTAIESGDYEARGKLTIRGIERNVVLPFSLKIEGDQAIMQGALTLVRTEFGVGQGQWQSGQWVGLEVRVSVDLTATRSAE